MDKKTLTRRAFLAGTTVALAGCASTPKKAPAALSVKAPNERLNVASIGCGGQGADDLRAVAHVEGVNIVALCDVDAKQAEKSFAAFADVPHYQDYRVLLEKEKSIEAVTVTIPDHMHAPVAMLAMSLGKHVYVQKPMAHSVYEARVLTAAARKYKVASQMGNQGHSAVGTRIACEMIWADAIGQVSEVHCWTDRPGGRWAQSIADPLPEEPVPPQLDWNIWIGPAPMRPYNQGYHPHKWRGWWDFGCGALGDMGCHIMDPANWALQLGPPSSVEPVTLEGCTAQTGPKKSMLKYQFPKRTWNKIEFCPVTLYWYEDGLLPPRPQGIDPKETLGDGGNGTLFMGEKGILTCSTYGNSPRLLPEERNKDYKPPEPTIPRVRGPYEDWVLACKGVRPSCSNFDYAGPLTETVILGNVAVRAGKRIEWDSANMKITNVAEANQYLRYPYREGWKLE